jgi:hypothetical protein
VTRHLDLLSDLCWRVELGLLELLLGSLQLVDCAVLLQLLRSVRQLLIGPSKLGIHCSECAGL